MIKNYRVSIQIDLNHPESILAIEKKLAKSDGHLLRWYIVEATDLDNGFCLLEIEATFFHSDRPVASPISSRKEVVSDSEQIESPVFVHIVPTGIQAAVGGSLGDAMPVNLFLSQLGSLVTHPNSCNGGALLLADRKSFLYTEGYALDAWSKGLINIAPDDKACIGVVIDCGVEDDRVIDKTINAVQGFYAHTGANIIGIELTEEAVGG